MFILEYINTIGYLLSLCQAGTKLAFKNMLLILLILENCSNLSKIVYHTDFVDGNYENLVFYVHWKNVWKSHNLFYMETELVGIS